MRKEKSTSVRRRSRRRRRGCSSRRVCPLTSGLCVSSPPLQVSTLALFKSILDEEQTLPREQPYKDLVALINYILRKFFKAVEEDSFLIVEVRPLALYRSPVPESVH